MRAIRPHAGVAPGPQRIHGGGSLLKLGSDGRAGAMDLYRAVRRATEELAAPLSAEDQAAQSMADASPTKWHRAHTTWFFETFLLQPLLSGWSSPEPAYAELFNSYYETVGPRFDRPRRGVLTRPSCAEVAAYRQRVDAGIETLIRSLNQADWAHAAPLLELGINHEQQHQELLLTDVLHLLSQNPMPAAYRTDLPVSGQPAASGPAWFDFAGGLVEIGHAGDGFAFDCEGPRHRVFLNPYRLAGRAVTNGEFLAFLEAGGYRDHRLWLAAGRAAVVAQGWEAPLYWRRGANGWAQFGLGGLAALDLSAPVAHISYFEADAYARWAGKRLPTEAEWESAATMVPITGNFADSGKLGPAPAGAPTGTFPQQLYGDVWEWTQSAFSPYPGFQPSPGAVGEYNGKFMIGQMVLRGGSCATPAGHVRPSYRNFFPPDARWQFSGLRLAEDLV